MHAVAGRDRAIFGRDAGTGCGPTIEGVATDMVTTLAVDSVAGRGARPELQRGAHTATVSTPAQAADGNDISAGGADDIRVGDLMMFTKGSVQRPGVRDGRGRRPDGDVRRPATR